MADVAEVMAQLEAAGTAQNRKVYPRHGVTLPLFGVSFAELGKLAKRHGPDQPLAEALWVTGNHDARVLATMVADPPRCIPSLMRRWAREIDNYIGGEALAKVAAHSPAARALCDEWIDSRDEQTAACGWNSLCSLAERRDIFSEAELFELLARIERTIHDAPNRVRHAMNAAVIAIGVCGGALEAAALAAAARIGHVDVDHGGTSCKTPDAAAYIRKTLAHRARKKDPR